MKVLHLGGNRLGHRVLEVLGRGDDDVRSATDLPGLERSMADGPVDWLVSAGFRHILGAAILGRVGDACNVHTSLLPWGRGARPNVWAIAEGEPAGVSLHRMVAGVDAGPVFAQRPVVTTFADTAADLYGRLEDAAVEMFAESWPRVRTGALQPRPQGSGGSFHRTGDFAALAAPEPDQQLTWRQALDRLRALTFAPHANVVVEEGGRRYAVDIVVRDVTDG